MSESVDEKIESIEEIKEKVNVSDVEDAVQDAAQDSKEDATEPSETEKKEVTPKPKRKTLDRTPKENLVKLLWLC